MGQDAHIDGKAISDPKLSYFYQIVILISVIANLILAVLSFRTSNAISQLDLERKKLETKLFEKQNSPIISPYRLIFETKAFSRFLTSKAPLPFTADITNIRVIDNEIYQAARGDIETFKKGQRVASSVSFLVFANTGGSPAYALTASGQEQIVLGDLDPKSAILVPLVYENQTQKKTLGEDGLIQFEYKRDLQDKAAAIIQGIPARASVAFIPVMNDPTGVGRASAEDDSDKRFEEFLEKKN